VKKGHRIEVNMTLQIGNLTKQNDLVVMKNIIGGRVTIIDPKERIEHEGGPSHTMFGDRGESL